MRLLWFDEFITLYIAKLNGFRAIWHALSQGVDPNPPLMHLLVTWSMRLFGENEIAVRLPAIAAGLVSIICLFVFLIRRVPLLYAVVGVVYFMGTAAFDYSYESRSYALMITFAIGSLLAWQSAVQGRHRTVSMILLAVSLAGGISSNYFAVLAFVPIALGEIVRTLESRKVTWGIWIALGAGAAPLLAYLPLINHSIARFAPHAWNKPHIGVIRDTYVQMVAINLIPAVLLLAVFGYMTWQSRGSKQWNTTVLPHHELAAVCMLISYPALGYIVAVMRAGMISPRFVLPVCFGLGIAVAVVSFRVFAQRPRFAIALLALLAVSFVVRESLIGYWFYNQRLAIFRVRDRLPSTDYTVVSDSLLVLPLHYYSPPKIASRIVFPIDFDAVRRWKKEDSPEQNLWAGRDVFPVPIVPLSEFQRWSSNYLIVTTKENWLIHKLVYDDVPVARLSIPTETKAIGGFFPLSHGEVYYFRTGSSVAKATPPDIDEGSTAQSSRTTSHNR